MKRLLILALALLPALASAQPVAPLPQNAAPLFGLPAQQGGSSNPFTNVVFTGQALGPDSCTAYSFTSAPTWGFGYNAISLCGNVGGVLTHQWGATYYALTSDSATFQGGLAGDVTIARAAGPTWVHAISGVTKLTLSSTLLASTVPITSGANVAATGQIRIGNSHYINGRNFLNTSDVQLIGTTSSNLIEIAGGGSAGVRFSGPYIAITSAGNVTWSATAPTGPVACTSPTVTWSNGDATWQIDVGTTCAGISTLVVTLPAKTNANTCRADNRSNAATMQPAPTAWGTTSITFTNFSRTTGLATDWADGADIIVSCTGG